MCVYAYTRAWSHFSCIWLFVTLWTVAHQAPLSKGFSRQEYWSGLPCPPLKHLPNPGIKPASLLSPTLAGKFFTTIATCEAHIRVCVCMCVCAQVHVVKKSKVHIWALWVKCATFVKIRCQIPFCLYVHKKTLKEYTRKWNKNGYNCREGEVRAGKKEDSYEIKALLLYAFERFLYFFSLFWMWIHYVFIKFKYTYIS